jgi:hypothetical protein
MVLSYPEAAAVGISTFSRTTDCREESTRRMAEELLVDQVLYSHLSKLFKGLLPLLSDSSWILARHKSVKGALVHQQFVHAVDLLICRI